MDGFDDEADVFGVGEDGALGDGAPGLRTLP